MRTYDPHRTTVEVRQGDRHQTNKRVLIISTSVVVIAFALIWAWFALYGGGASITPGV